MARIEQRVPQNIRGRFYVEWSCIYCDLCAQTAPTISREFHEQGGAYVYRQPATDEEVKAAMEAADGCPTESIGFDGDQHDWDAIPSVQDLTNDPKA